MPAIPLPPRKLAKHGRALWNRVHTEYRLDDVGSQELLCQACTALDRAEALADRIRSDGETLITRAGPRAHPGIRDELAARGFVVRTIQKLGLTYETIRPVGRPGTALSWEP
jgi:hypothetical protein